MPPGPRMPWLPPSMGHVAIGAQQQQARLRSSAIEALEAITQDRELLQRSADLARQTAAGNLTPEEAARQISQDSPEVASLLERLPAALRSVVIFVLIQAILFFAEHYLADVVWDHPATSADVERILRQHDREHDREMHREIQDAVEQALREYETRHPADAEPPEATTPTPKKGH